jgi:L-rhamnose isomerase/sugar isomerase
VDHAALTVHQTSSDLVAAEECLKDAFATDVRPAIAEWRKSKGLPENPLQAFRASGYTEMAIKERSEKNTSAIMSYA